MTQSKVLYKKKMKERAMKGKILFFGTIAFILTLSFVLSEDFSGYKYSGDKFSLNGDNFSVQLSKDEKTVFVKYNDESFLFSGSSCKETEKRFYFICLKGVVLNLSANIGKIDDITGEEIPALNMTISYRKPDITIKRALSKTNPFVNDDVDVILSIENNGKLPASLNIIETIPSGFEITAFTGKLFSNNEIMYSLTINAGTKNEFSYKIKPLKRFSGYIYGNATFVYETVNGTIKVDKSLIETVDSVKVTVNLTEKKLKLEKTASLSLILENKDSVNSAKVNMTFLIPDGLEVYYKTPSDLKSNGKQLYNYDSYLEKLDSKIIRVDFKAIKSGEHIIWINLTYATPKTTQLTQKNTTITVEPSKLSPSIIIDDELISGQKARFRTIIKNNETIDYYSLKAKIESAILNEEILSPDIPKNNEKIVFEKEIFAPIVNAKTDIIINFSGEYKTSESEIFNFSIAKKIGVYPLQDLVVIFHEFDKYLNDSDKAKIKVYVENKRNVTLDNVDVNEKIPKSLNLIEGNIKNMIDIGPKRKMLMYIYTVQTTDNKSEEITTALRFIEDDKEYSLNQPILLNMTSKAALNQKSNSTVIKNNASGIINNGSDIKKINNISIEKNESVANTPVKKSIWKRIILWIDGFF